MPGWVRDFVDQQYPNRTRLVTDDAPPDSIDEAWFRTHVPAIVGDYRVLEVRDFRPTDHTDPAPSALALTYRAQQFSTHVVHYDPQLDHWRLDRGHLGIPTRREAVRNLTRRGELSR